MPWQLLEQISLVSRSTSKRRGDLRDSRCQVVPFPCDLFAMYYRFSDVQSYLATHHITIPPSAATKLPYSSTNASSSADPFSYIIPYNQPQKCDIFGPLCQTGLIAVGVSLASSTTTTTLPCSDYLSAQATHLLSGRVESGGRITLQDACEWLTSFGRSPQCKTYAEIHRYQERYTLTDCGSENTIIQASQGFSLPTQIPPGVVDRFRPLDYSCCGNCTLKIPQVRLIYFPDQEAPECENQPSNSSATVSARALDKRVQSFDNTGSIAVLSGHTLYVPFSGHKPRKLTWNIVHPPQSTFRWLEQQQSEMSVGTLVQR